MASEILVGDLMPEHQTITWIIVDLLPSMRSSCIHSKVMFTNVEDVNLQVVSEICTNKITAT